MAIIPESRPKENESMIRTILKENKISDAMALIGWRGYYLNKMGVKGKNDIAIYDDAFFLVGPNFFASYNGNTDPSRYTGSPNSKGMAILKPGKWLYKLGIHNLGKAKSRQYQALVQATEVIVDRIQSNGHTLEDKGYFGINIHRGGNYNTSSLGCQTIYPTQWQEFINNVKLLLKRTKQAHILYLLRNDPRM
jgi:lysozyme